MTVLVRGHCVPLGMDVLATPLCFEILAKDNGIYLKLVSCNFSHSRAFIGNPYQTSNEKNIFLVEFWKLPLCDWGSNLYYQLV